MGQSTYQAAAGWTGAAACIPAAANAGDDESTLFQEKRALVKQIWLAGKGFGEVDTAAAPR